MNNYKQSRKVTDIAHELEFGSVLDKAFNNYKKIVGTAGIALLLMTIVYLALLFGIMGIAFGFSDFTGNMTNFNLTQHSSVFTIGYVVVVAVVSGIMANLYAGFYKMAHLAEVEKPYEIGTVFESFKTIHFKELFLSGAFISIVTTSITLSLQYLSMDPITSIIGVGINYVIIFLTVLTTPLILFSKLKAVEAIQMSLQLVLKNFFAVLGLLIIAVILSLLGFIGFCIGIFFTLPFLFSMVYCIYSEILPIEETNVIDLIGTKEEE